MKLASIASVAYMCNAFLSYNASAFSQYADRTIPGTSSNSTSSIKSEVLIGDSHVHPIEIDGKHFYDSFTKQRFLIKGVDYQPGGSAAYTRDADPLSDTDQCSRDIYLMQKLGINTVRVYTVNPKLNHDDCMTMMAAANIYLILDVNSPFYSESLNRYEPWTTYTPEYLRHVFEVVDQFSRYNNTLGFFIGNEIVNDDRSAASSPPYIRAVSRDVKDYMYYNCPRMVPIGYSAADDLKYRTQLPDFLTCGDPETAIDFYGVNSYQWCGNQTIKTSGYDVLIDDHRDFKFPVFFSEFGCNHIQPRIFQEIEALYSPEMSPTFDGGLVYEYSQEVNDYGLVQITENGDVYVRGEFETLQMQYVKASEAIESAMEAAKSSNTEEMDNGAKLRSGQKLKTACKPIYSYLSGAEKAVPDSFGTDMIKNGVRIKRGRYNIDLLIETPVSKYSIYGIDGKPIHDHRISIVNNFTLHASELGWVPREGVYRSRNGDQVGQLKPNKDRKRKGKNGATKLVPRCILAAVLGTLLIVVV